MVLKDEEENGDAEEDAGKASWNCTSVLETCDYFDFNWGIEETFSRFD